MLRRATILVLIAIAFVPWMFFGVLMYQHESHQANKRTLSRSPVLQRPRVSTDVRRTQPAVLQLPKLTRRPIGPRPRWGTRILTPVEYKNTLHDLFRISIDESESRPTSSQLPVYQAVSGGNLTADNHGGLSGPKKSHDEQTMSESTLRLADYVIYANHLVYSEKFREHSKLWNFLFVEDTGKNVRPLKSQAAQRLNLFLPRAFRGPVTAQTRAKFVEHFEQQLKRSGSFGEAMKSTVVATLISPRFVYRKANTEFEATKDAYTIASQLSYFLWSSMPDDLLLQAAREGRLLDKNEIREQVRRMLGNPRSRALTDNFVTWWLKKPSAAQYSLFHQLLAEDRSIIQLVAPVGVNSSSSAIAELHAPGIFNASYKTRRAGSLPNCSVLETGVPASSNASTLNSVTVDGNWLMEVIFNRPPASGENALKPNSRISRWIGSSNNEIEDVREWIVSEEKSFVTGFVEHLMHYMLERRLDTIDRPAASAIVNTVRFNGNRFHNAIEEVAIHATLGQNHLFVLPKRLTRRKNLAR